MTELLERARSFLFRRRYAYQKVFDRENVYLEEVLKDLARFCRAHETTFNSDPRAHALAEGRREVWLRIANHLNLSEDELWKLYGTK